MDYLAKPDYGEKTKAALLDELPRKIRMAAGCDVHRILEIRREQKARLAERVAQRNGARAGKPPGELGVSDKPAGVLPIAFPAELTGKCIAIGISTGGPPALAQLFASLRPPLPPIVVVQHMPPNFTKPLAWRLDSISELTIKEAAVGDLLVPNQVLIAPGGKHLEIRRLGGAVKAVIRDGPVVSGHKPSVDVMMNSVVAAYGGSCLGVIMTGMGRDGADGFAAIRRAGGYVLGQDEDTSDVYGMNKVALCGGQRRPPVRAGRRRHGHYPAEPPAAHCRRSRELVVRFTNDVMVLPHPVHLDERGGVAERYHAGRLAIDLLHRPLPEVARPERSQYPSCPKRDLT